MKPISAPRVLVVDNDPLIRFVLKLQLEERGYHIAACENGKEALDLLRRTHHPHIVLTDVVMPEMDGLDLLETVLHEPELRNRHAFALMTGAYPHLAARTDRVLARLGAPVLLKPYEVEDLYEVVGLMTQRLHATHPAAA